MLRILVVTLLVLSSSTSRACGEEEEPALKVARARFKKKIADLTWVCYNPSTFRPPSAPGEPPRRVTEEEIETDLRALIRAGFEPHRTGLCTYSCSRDSGLSEIGRVAKRLEFGGHVLGVWNLVGDELPTTVELARDGCCDAICVGNEGLDDRYSWEELSRVMMKLRSQTKLPVSTSEQIDDYGLKELCDPDQVDFLYPNVHPVFYGRGNPREAAEFSISRTLSLKKRSPLMLLVHETGWPSSGRPVYTPEAQREFWRELLTAAEEKQLSFAVFEALDQAWKHELQDDDDVGPHWGWLTSKREPKEVTNLLRRVEEKKR